MFLRFMVTLSLSVWSSSAGAWWDEGHMRVAAMAYELLTPQAKTEANRLIKLNPKYGEWAAAVPETPDGRPKDVDRYTFIRASVWADDIKTYKLYRDASKNDDVMNPEAAQNVGYSDLLIHGYWHYKDIAFSTDQSNLPAPDPVDLVTQLKLFAAALPKGVGHPDDIRSYDLVWLLHLVGDAHQPLHSTALFSEALSLKHQLEDKPDSGDRGGNEIDVSPATGEAMNLHAYWDAMFGGYSTVDGAIFDSFIVKKISGGEKIISKLLPAPDEKAAISDPEVWLSESHQLALKFAYAEPVLPERHFAELTRQYEAYARKVAEEQISLAAARLAGLINEALK
jgi:S1/P1 Nuclease